MVLIYVGGVPGVGKTTTTEALVGLEPVFVHVRSGEIKAGEAYERFGKWLGNLNQRETFEINTWFLKEVPKRYPNTDVLVDSHYTHPRNNGFVRFIHDDYCSMFDLLILFETTAEKIIERRKEKGSRILGIDKIKNAIKREREEALRISQFHSTPIEIIRTGKNLDSVVDDLRQRLNKYGLI